ncbi:cupredoxin family copper-binding protein [Mycolicibacterium sp.]|uniref:cupredoxin domain-containing protein n=1 Tax=Mycolicibacterium sp. TaxID=2320850 RepID=UPI001A3003CC|nr:cupredoxin family copper-binding protein [Mycolicibacterium sp.]MBJ7339581.1 cupredoxin family copper-binding protein [Mycolicibacterium sp.]
MRPARSGAALGVLAALTAAASVLLAGCSGSGSAPLPDPSVTFGAQTSTTPGFAGNGTAGPAAPAPGTSAGTAGTGAPAGGPSIGIDNFMFAPATLTVPVGSTVTWTNHDGEPHTVVANDGSFHSPGMDTGASFSFTFTAPGSFDYICSIHPFMHATVVVTR